MHDRHNDYTPHGKRPASMVMVRIRGNEYPVKFSERCRTCTSPHRRWLEHQLILGISYVDLAKAVLEMEPGDKPAPDYQSIRRHVVAGHLPEIEAVRQQIIEQRAEELGASVEQGARNIIDGLTMSRLVVQTFYEDLVEGRAQLNHSDANAAARFIREHDQAAGQGATDEMYQQAMMQYMLEAQKYIPAELWTEYGKALMANPILQALSSRLEAERKALEAADF